MLGLQVLTPFLQKTKMEHQPTEKLKLELKEKLKLAPKPDFKRIKCPSCDSVVPATNLNINDKIGKCDSCDSVFPFHQDIAEFINPKKLKQEVLKPEGIEIFEYRDEKEFSIQQPLIPFDIFSVLFVFLFMLFSTLLYLSGKIALIYPATAWTLALFPIYSMINRKNQKVYLTIDEEFFHIKWRPKKLTKDQKYLKKTINQIYVKSFGGRNSIYMIVDGTDGQKHIKLVGEIMSLSKARYLEQEIEKWLEIEDREVPEETK